MRLPHFFLFFRLESFFVNAMPKSKREFLFWIFSDINYVMYFPDGVCTCSKKPDRFGKSSQKTLFTGL